MSKLSRLDRRAFLRSTGMTAIAGAVGATVPLAAETGGGARRQDGRYDFDTIYSRIGTDSSKWDAQIARYGRDKIEVGMGTADQDFRIAPPITRALRERIGHENYGYLSIPASYKESIVDWNRRRYGLEIDPDTIQHAAGVHAGVISTLRAFCPPGSKVLMQTPGYNGFYTDIRVVGCVAEESPLKLVDGRYQMDFEDLERRIDHDTHAFILCQPAQPDRQRVVAGRPDDPRRDLHPAAGGGAGRRDPLRLRHQGPHLHAVRHPRRRGHRPQQRHLQVGEQVVQPVDDEVRLPVLDQPRTTSTGSRASGSIGSR